jgi:hypothetical protein
MSVPEAFTPSGADRRCTQAHFFRKQSTAISHPNKFQQINEIDCSPLSRDPKFTHLGAGATLQITGGVVGE